MVRHLSFCFFFLSIVFGKAQCPLLYDYLGNLSANPLFINCSGGAYPLNLQSNSSFGSYTVSWGDGSPNTTGPSYTANSIISHTYAATTNTYVITLTVGSVCTRTALVVMERAVTASIQVPISSSLACAPRTLTFTNASLNVSSTTSFTWSFGDGTPAQVFNSTNAGQSLIHAYQKGTVNCQTTATLLAENYCSFGIPAFAYNGPINIYDIDDAAITADQLTRCWPDNLFTFTNATNRNCVPQGNINQRFERWNLGNHWGKGQDSIVGWNTWPPSAPLAVAFPTVGTYTISLLDSNMCGIDPAAIVVQIVNPPTASLIAPTGNLCQNTTLTFTNASTPGQSYLWNFGKGAGFVNLGNGNKTQSYPNPGTYTVQLITFINGGGATCRDTSSAIITILAAPVAAFVRSPSSGCNSLSNVTFTNNSTGAATYSWTFNNGNTNSAQTPPSQNYTTTGTFITTLVATATTGCVHSATASVIVRPKPIPDFTAFAACVGATITFTNSSTPAAGANAITSYTWHLGDSNASNAATPTHSYTAPNTYTVKLITSSAFCIDSVAKTVTVNIKPTAGIIASPTVGCPPLVVSFTNTSVNATNFLWRFAPSITSTTTGNTSFIFSNTSQSIQHRTVTLIASTGIGCADSTTQQITVWPSPVADFTSNITAGCSPFAVTFSNTSVGATTYSWSFGDGNSSAQFQPVHSYTNNSLFQQTVTVNMIATNSLGCSGLVSKPVIVYAKPDVSVTMVPSSGCNPLVVTFPPVPGVATYTWDHGDGSPKLITTNAPHTHTFINNGTTVSIFTVSLIASNVSGCIDSAKGNAQVFPSPIISLAVTPTIGCSPHTASFTGNNNLTGSTYYFRFGDGQTNTASATNTVTHTYTNTTSSLNQAFSPTMVVTSIHGCKDSASANIQVYYKPFAQFSLDTPRCKSTAITFTNQSIGAANYMWSFGDGTLPATQQNPIHTYTPNSINNQNYTVNLLVTSVNGCTSSISHTATVYALPVANAVTSATAGCSPFTVTFTPTGQFAHSYIWRFGDGTQAATASTIHTYNNQSSVNDQTVVAQLVAINNNSCRDSVSMPLVVFFKPDAKLNNTSPGCTDPSVSFFNTSLGSVSQTWNFGDNSPLSSAVNPVHTYTNTGINNQSFTVTMIVNTQSSCSDTAYAYPVVLARPIADFSLNASAGCAPFTANFAYTGQNAHLLLWKLSGGVTATTTTASQLYLNSTTQNLEFNASLVVANNNGCKDSTVRSFTVYPQPQSVFTADTPVCSPKEVLFVNKSAGAVSYKWDLGDGTTSTATGTVSRLYVNGSSNPVPVGVRLIATSANSCTDTSFLNFQVYPKLNLFIGLKPDSGCTPLKVRFDKLQGVTDYFWTFEPGNYSEEAGAENIFVNTGNVPKTFEVQLIGKNVHQCADTATRTIKVFPKPSAKFTANPLEVYIPNDEVKCFNLSTGATSYLWQFGDGAVSDEKEPLHAYQQAGEFEIVLIATNDYGCKDTAILPEKVVALGETLIQLPNAFTPNLSGPSGRKFDPDDKSNDIFHPNVKGTEQYQLSIYSRWGELLFDTRDPGEGWDGYYKGKLCTQEVYVYKIVATFVDGRRIVKTGDLLLLR